MSQLVLRMRLHVKAKWYLPINGFLAYSWMPNSYRRQDVKSTLLSLVADELLLLLLLELEQ